MSWLTKKMEVTVAGLGNSLKRLEDSTAVKHGQLVTMVTSAIENKQATLEERVHLLEKVQLIIEVIRGQSVWALAIIWLIKRELFPSMKIDIPVHMHVM